jgi:cytochrome c oxidase assembly protein subunit 15
MGPSAMTEQDWNFAFEKYQQIAQYKYLNSHFTLADLNSFFHRMVSSSMGKIDWCCIHHSFHHLYCSKKFKKDDQTPVLFFLLGLQGLVGWIMVQSGLEDSELLYVSHYKLAIHFILALGLLCYTTWFALDLLVPAQQLTINSSLRNFTGWLMGLLTLQVDLRGALWQG